MVTVAVQIRNRFYNAVMMQTELQKSVGPDFRSSLTLLTYETEFVIF